MKFALAGNNPTAFDVLRELATSSEHTLVRCSLAGELAAVVSRNGVPVTLAASVEDALLASDVDTVIIAIDDLDESLRMVRAAAQSARNVVVIPPAECSPAYSFELHLILDESQCGIMPLLPRAVMGDLPLSEVDLGLNEFATRQLSIELQLSQTGPGLLHRTVIQGLDYLSSSGFKFTQVTALESNAPDGSLLSRLITLSAAPTAEKVLPPATLTIKPAADSGKPAADSGNAATHAGIRSLQVFQNTGVTRSVAIAEAGAVLNRIATVCESRELCGKWMDGFSVTLELAEAVSKSLRRRRTVDVHFDSGSEKGVFKSQMTAMGCGILTFMMFGMVAYLILAQLVELPDTVLHILRVLWIAPLVLFLIAQTLLPLARDRSTRE